MFLSQRIDFYLTTMEVRLHKTDLQQKLNIEGLRYS
jgi:hypothetical protein